MMIYARMPSSRRWLLSALLLLLWSVTKSCAQNGEPMNMDDILDSGKFVLFPEGTSNRTLTITQGVADTCPNALQPLFSGNFTYLQDLTAAIGSQFIVVPSTPELVDVLIFPRDDGFTSLFNALGVTAEQALANTSLLEETLAMHVAQAVNINASESETISQDVLAFVDGKGNSLNLSEFPDLSLSDGKDELFVKGPTNEIQITSIEDCNEPGRANRKFVLYTDEVLLPMMKEEDPDATQPSSGVLSMLPSSFYAFAGIISIAMHIQ